MGITFPLLHTLCKRGFLYADVKGIEEIGIVGAAQGKRLRQDVDGRAIVEVDAGLG